MTPEQRKHFEFVRDEMHGEPKQEQGEPDWKALVLNHNADCESRCDMDRCGYKPYFEYSKRRCPDCPVHEMIDVEYTTPPQRTWVGLTVEEINEVLGGDIHDEPNGLLEFVKAIEAKLKEKNTWQDGDCKHCVNGCPACDARKLTKEKNNV